MRRGGVRKVRSLPSKPSLEKTKFVSVTPRVFCRDFPDPWKFSKSQANSASRWEGVRLLRGSGKSPDFPGSSPNFPGSFSATSPEVLSLWNLTAIQGFPGSFPDFSGSSPDFPGSFPDFPGGQPLSLGNLTPSPDPQKLSLTKSLCKKNCVHFSAPTSPFKNRLPAFSAFSESNRIQITLHLHDIISAEIIGVL